MIIHTYCIKIGRRNFSLQDSTKILTIFFFISGCAFDTSLQEENNWFVTSLFKFIYGLHNLCWVIYDISKWMPLSVTEYVDKTLTVNDSLLLTVTILTKCWVTVSDSNFFLILYRVVIWKWRKYLLWSVIYNIYLMFIYRCISDLLPFSLQLILILRLYNLWSMTDE